MLSSADVEIVLMSIMLIGDCVIKKSLMSKEQITSDNYLQGPKHIDLP